MDFSRAVRARFRDNHFFFPFLFFFAFHRYLSIWILFFLFYFLPSLPFSLSFFFFFIKFEKFPRPHSFLINHTTWKIEAFICTGQFLFRALYAFSNIFFYLCRIYHSGRTNRNLYATRDFVFFTNGFFYVPWFEFFFLFFEHCIMGIIISRHKFL